MYKKLLKKFYKTQDPTQTQKEANMKQPDMATQELNVELAAQLAASSSAATLQAAAFEEITQKFAEMSALYEVAQAALVEADIAKAALVAQAAEKRLSARKEVVVLALGTEKADAFLAATHALDDANFEAIVGSMSMSFKQEAKGDGFKELGVAGLSHTPSKEESLGAAEMKILKAKYAR